MRRESGEKLDRRAFFDRGDAKSEEINTGNVITMKRKNYIQ